MAEKKDSMAIETLEGVIDLTDLQCIGRFVLIVVGIAKCLLDRQETSRFFAVIVLEEKKVLVVTDLKKDHRIDLILGASRCLKQLVINAAKSVKFLLGHQQINRSFATIVLARVIRVTRATT